MANLPSLEELFTQDFGVTTPEPVQRAICRIADGKPLGNLWGHPEVMAAIGELPKGERFIPKTMVLLCAIRSGKSAMSGAAAVRNGLTCDTSVCGPGDVPRVPILSTHKDEAKATMDHLVGAFTTSPRLRPLLVKDPTVDTITFRHPTGRHVEIKVVAGSRAGTSLAARFLAGVIFDEAAKMVGGEEGVINLDDARHNVAGRLMRTDCASEWLPSSPWAPFGPVYELVTQHFGKPTRDMVVVRARGDMMNRRWWTPERIAELERTNPDAYQTDYLAEFADPDAALIAGVHIDAATRQAPLDLVPGEPRLDPYEYAAEMDPATRGNGWTLVVTRRVGRKTQVCLAREWRGTKTAPLSSKRVLAEMAALLIPFRIANSPDGRKRVGSDQAGIDLLRELGRDVGDEAARRGEELPALDIVEFPATRKSNNEGYVEMARRFELGEMEIPNVPNLVSDLRRLRKKVTQAGFYIDLPTTSDGRHCDFAPSLMRAAQRETYQPGKVDPRPQWKVEQDASIERAIKKHVRHNETPWWKRSVG
jgi:hypothetical protein